MGWGYDMKQTVVRGIFRAVRIPGLSAPHDTAHLKIHYPAALTGTALERDTGLVPVMTGSDTFPIVILMSGINVSPEGLGWLARSLCLRGLVVVSFALIGEDLPGQVSLTPGIDISALTPAPYGTRSSALAIAPILAELAVCHQTGVLAGRLDLTKVALGGHSAGGTVALLNANPAWFEGVCAAFAYGAHTAASTLLGHPAGTMSAIPSNCPVLIMGGSEDGVIAASAARYGDPQTDATARVIATFGRAVTRQQGDCVLAIIKGANHFSIIDPQDDTTGRAFLDRPDTSVDARRSISDLVWAFLARAMNLPEADLAWDKIDALHHKFALFDTK
jgi:dienelactone hydrolase